MKQLSIGITIENGSNQHQQFFGNGLSQNIKFLYDILLLIGHKPFFLLYSPATDNVIAIGEKEYCAYSIREIQEKNLAVDIVIEAGVTIPQMLRSLIRKHLGSVIVSVRYGHTMFMDMEQICHPETLTKGLCANQPDIVWASPHFENSFSYLETIYNAPVAMAPYIWEPDFVRAEPFSVDDFVAKPHLWVMEPNISLLKNALIPMAIIERQYRANPEVFDKAVILNGLSFNQREYFTDNIVKNMTSLQSTTGKVSFGGRYSFEKVFKQRDVLLGHQYGCELNYLYLEAFYMNVPLVHNSSMLKDAGYYYPEFRVDVGQSKLEQAINDSDVLGYHEQAKKMLYRYSIHSDKVQGAYIDLLARTYALRK